ncbi:MAG: MFS transporter [Actinomycetota bacterium]|nr:MFS transporter [Actinomycetota bacterium]
MRLTEPLVRRRLALIDRLSADGRYPRWVLVTALMGIFSVTFPVTVLSVAIGDMAREFGVRETTMALVVSVPFLLSGLALPITGKLGDLYGHRVVFIYGFALATVGAALTVFAPNALAVIACRTFSQVVGSATIPASSALVLGVHAPDERTKAMGWWSFVAAAAPAIGLVVGGLVIDSIGWRLLFGIQAVLSAIAVVAAWIVLSETTERKRVRFDIAGAALLVLGAGGLMGALDRGEAWGWTHWSVYAGLVACVVGLVGFTRVERRTASPLIDLDLLSNTAFRAPLVSMAFFGAAYMSGFVLAPLMFQEVLGYSAAATSLFMGLRPVSVSTGSAAVGRLSDAVGPRTTTIIGTGLLSGSLLLLAFGSSREAVWLMCIAIALQGIANGTTQPALQAAVSNAVDDEDLGIAMASLRMAMQVGASLGISALSSIYGGVNEAGRFGATFAAGAGFAVIAVIAARGVDARTEARAEAARARTAA